MMMPAIRAVRRDVERGIPDVRAFGRELRAADVRHLARVSLLDRNVRGRPASFRSIVESGAAT